MKKSFSIALASGVFLLSLLGIINADLIERDWINPGDNSVLYDTDTGLDWLDLDQTAGFSYNTVSSELGSGATYEGFRYASQEDLFTLFQNANIPDINGWSISNLDPIQALFHPHRHYLE